MFDCYLELSYAASSANYYCFKNLIKSKIIVHKSNTINDFEHVEQLTLQLKQYTKYRDVCCSTADKIKFEFETALYISYFSLANYVYYFCFAI